MALLEKQFRGRFAARDGSYVFRQWGHEVVFTLAEYEGFVAERGRLWSGWTFGIYLLLGVAAPVWLWLADMTAGAWALGGVALLVLIVILTHGERLPNGVAETRVNVNDPASAARYTPEEYDREMARQRESIREPLRWIWSTTLPLAGLVAVYLDGHPRVAGVCGGLLLILLLYNLIEVHRAPGVAARRRARGEPEPEKGRERSLWDLVSSAVLFTMIASGAFTDRTPDYRYTRWFFVAFALFYLGTAALRYYRSRTPRPA